MAKANIKPPTRRPSGKGMPPSEVEMSRTLDTPQGERTVQLNFTVPESFKDEFKDYAHFNKMKLKEVLLEAFAMLKEQTA